MCLKPQPPRPIPPDTKAMVGRMLDEATVYRFVGDVLFERFHDQDFADLYPKTGQPALSPVLLCFVLIFKALERCSNRQAAINVHFRQDWKYALHLPLDYPGFDPSVLVEFRQRLLDNGVEARIFNAIFKELRELGFYKPRGIQRTDSTPIYTHFRTLHRIELMVETLRRAVFALLDEDPDWARATIPGVWEERYRQRCKSERLKEDERQALAVTAGDDGQWLLDRLNKDDAEHLRELDAIETLRDVWTRHYIKDETDGHLRWNEAGERGGSDVIETPHDPETRWSTKRKQDWIGYKLQVTETDDEGYPHLITDIAITPAPESDMAALEEIRKRQQAQDTLPSERYVDSGYVSGELLKDGRSNGEELVGPIRTTVTAQSKLPNGLTHKDFQIDLVSGQVICPAGIEVFITNSGDDSRQATFPAAMCQTCPLKERCCTGKKEGRSLRFGPHYQETQELRRRQQTERFKVNYGAHRGGVEGCLSALIRGQGLRVTRHAGCRNNHLHALFAGAAVNLARCAAFRGGYVPKKRPARLGLVVAQEAAAVLTP